MPPTRKEYSAYGGVVQGRLQLEDTRSLQAALQTAILDGPVMVTITPIQGTRSPQQNNFWWGVVVKRFSDYCGEWPKKMHEVLKTELLGEHHILPGEGGKIVREVVVPAKSTTVLAPVEFNDLILGAQHLGSEMGLYIPDPNEPDGFRYEEVRHGL